MDATQKIEAVHPEVTPEPYRATVSMWLRKAFIDAKLGVLSQPFENMLRTVLQVSKYANWVRANDNLPALADRDGLYECLVAQFDLADAEFQYLEFGVYMGGSMNWWLHNTHHPKTKYVGFDTFTGLPEAWGQHDAGAFSAGGRIPEFGDPRCSFQVGLFQDTLPGFVQTLDPNVRKVINMDADLYSSTLFCLAVLTPWLTEGDVIIFDELCSVRNEFRAFEDFCAAFPVELTPVARTSEHSRAAFVVAQSGLQAA